MGVCCSTNPKENHHKDVQIKKKPNLDVNDASEFIPNLVSKN